MAAATFSEPAYLRARYVRLQVDDGTPPLPPILADAAHTLAALPVDEGLARALVRVAPACVCVRPVRCRSLPPFPPPGGAAAVPL